MSYIWQLYLAGENVAKSWERVIQGFVVNGLVKVLDEHVAHSRLPEGGVSLGPHDSDWLPFDYVKVHGVQGSLSYGGGGGQRGKRSRVCLRGATGLKTYQPCICMLYTIFSYIYPGQYVYCSTFTKEIITSVTPKTSQYKKNHIKLQCGVFKQSVHLRREYCQREASDRAQVTWLRRCSRPCGWWAAGTGVGGSCIGQAVSTWPPSLNSPHAARAMSHLGQLQ